MKSKIIFLLILSFIIIIQTVYAVNIITNGDFETGTTSSWNKYVIAGGSGTMVVDSNYSRSGSYGMRIWTTNGQWTCATHSSAMWSQFNEFSMWYKMNNFSYPGDATILMGDTYHTEWSSTEQKSTWTKLTLPTNNRVAYLRICISGGGELILDDVYGGDVSNFTLNGYIKNNYGNSVYGALVELNGSAGSDSTNESGYYEISDISSGTYTISATSPTHQDYTESGISITSNTVKNITMTKLTPVLSNVRIIDKTDTYIWLGWNENTVVDSVNVFKDTDSHLFTTVNTAGSNVGSYKDQNLACDKGYVYWLQPVDGSVTGAKTRIDGETDPCNDGGGDGGTPTPTPTPGPTPPPWINITDDEWLSLTLDEKYEILGNLTLNLPMVIKPWLNISFEDLWDWLLLLLIIICLTVWLDSFTTQKISRDWGFIAILPAIYFGYIGGYFII